MSCLALHGHTGAILQYAALPWANAVQRSCPLAHRTFSDLDETLATTQPLPLTPDNAPDEPDALLGPIS